LVKKTLATRNDFIVRSYGGSTSWVHALFPYKFNSTSFLNPQNLRPIMFVGIEKDRKEVDYLELSLPFKGRLRDRKRC
jgi:hypothetical protein